MLIIISFPISGTFERTICKRLSEKSVADTVLAARIFGSESVKSGAENQ